MMAEYIDRRSALNHIYKRLIETANNNVGFKCDAGIVYEDAATNRIKTWINEVPSADVVEVVRCKDCKHRILNENYGIKGHLIYTKAICDLDTGDYYELGREAWKDDWFCADGERN